jgi:hypothetical protein
MFFPRGKHKARTESAYWNVARAEAHSRGDRLTRHFFTVRVVEGSLTVRELPRNNTGSLATGASQSHLLGRRAVIFDPLPDSAGWWTAFVSLNCCER